MNNNPIQCVGIDGKIHYCQPNLNVTICNIQVKRKKLLKNDLISSHNKGYCPECDYTNDDIIFKNNENSC